MNTINLYKTKNSENISIFQKLHIYPLVLFYPRIPCWNLQSSDAR